MGIKWAIDYSITDLGYCEIELIIVLIKDNGLGLNSKIE